MADHMGAVDAKCIQHRDHVVACNVLRVAVRFGRHVRGRIATLTVRDAAVLPVEIPHLRFPAAVVTGKFMHKNHRSSDAALLYV